MISILILLFIFSCCVAFQPTGRGTCAFMTMKFNLDKAVNTLSSKRILTKTAELGLLSKLDKAGFTLTTAKPLLKLADEVDALGYLEASSDTVLSLAGTAIETAPALLPLAGAALKAGPTPLYLGAAASAGAAAAIIFAVPDETVTDIAIQTASMIGLGLVLPGALTVGGTLLSKISK